MRLPFSPAGCQGLLMSSPRSLLVLQGVIKGSKHSAWPQVLWERCCCPATIRAGGRGRGWGHGSKKGSGEGLQPAAHSGSLFQDKREVFPTYQKVVT